MDPEALQTLSKVEGPVIKKASVREGPVLQFNDLPCDGSLLPTSATWKSPGNKQTPWPFWSLVSLETEIPERLEYASWWNILGPLEILSEFKELNVGITQKMKYPSKF